MSDAAFIDYLHELLSGLGPITTRRMFGGYGIYHGDRMFALAFDSQLFFKVDAETADAFRAAGSAPFVYEGKGKTVQMSYWTAPEEAMDSPHAMRDWARLAYAAALRKPVGKGRKGT